MVKKLHLKKILFIVFTLILCVNQSLYSQYFATVNQLSPEDVEVIMKQSDYNEEIINFDNKSLKLAAICQDITVQLDALGSVSISPSDINNGSTGTLSIDISSFNCSNIGPNVVTLTSDDGGTIATCDAIVTVEDNVAPVALCQAVTVQLDASGNGSITTTDIDNGSNDACGIASLALDTTSFTCANVGANTVTLTVTDNNGNVSTCDAIVTVEDNVAPTAVCQNITVQLDAAGNGTLVVSDIDGGSTDACGIVSLSASKTSFDCTNIGANTVRLTVTDNNGNVSTCDATVTVEDNVDPVVPTLPVINAECSTTVIPPTTTDNCAGTITGTTIDPLIYSTQGAHMITWNFNDGNGNDIDVVQTVFINDTTNPIAVCQNLNIQLNDTNGTAVITSAQIDNGSSDNCNFTLAIDKSTFDCSDIGDNFVVLTATDDNGNTDSCTAIVTVNSPNINGGTLTGYLENTETIVDADDIIEVTACPEEEQKNARLSLTGESGTVSYWESSTNGGLNWSTISNTSNSYYFTNILQTTLVRAVVQIGSCEARSSIVYLAVVPPDLPPTIVGNTTFDNCMGNAVTVVAESAFGINPDFNEGGMFNEANLNTLGWVVDGESDMSAGGSNTNNTWWKETTGPKKFNNRCYSSPDGTKFAIASGIPPTDADHTISPVTTLETTIFNTLGLTEAFLEFDQAYYLEAGAWVNIELSLDGGATYPITLDPGSTYDFIGPSTSGFDDIIGGGQCKNAIEYTYIDNHVSIDLTDFIGLTGLRIKFTYSGTANSAWALENISIPYAPIDEVLEWTDENGVVVTTGSTVNINPVTPGIQVYGATSLINSCRAAGDEGTEFITINASLAYAGVDINPVVGECGESVVTLAAYDNTLTAIQNNANGVWDNSWTLPDISNGDTDYPGTGEHGFWTVDSSFGVCATSYNFSNINDPNSTFTAEPGVYTLTWTVAGCSDSIQITIDNCDSLDFDGTDDYVTFNDNYNFSSNYSIECWVKPESVSGTQTIFSKRDANNTSTGYDLSLNGGTVEFNWNNTGLNSAPYTLSTDRWYHIGVVYNSGNYTLYIDGVEIKTSGGSLPSSNTMNCLLGAMDQDNNPPNKPVGYFDGWIDELRIWNTAITEEQLHQMMNQEIEDNILVRGVIVPLDINGLNWTNLDGYYRMNLNCGAIQPNAGTVVGKLRNMYSSQQETAPIPYISNDDSSWNNSTTWLNGDVQSIPNSTGIDGTDIDWNIVQLTHNINSGTRDITLLGLLSESGELTIDGATGPDGTGTGQMLWITHYLNLNGVIDLEGESQLVQKRYTASQFNESILNSSSSGYIERDQQGTRTSFNYNYWSSPVIQTGTTNSTYTVAQVLRDGTDPANPKNINFVNGYFAADGARTDPIKITNSWIYKFNGTSENYWSWVHIGSTANLAIGDGHTMKGVDGIVDYSIKQNYVFQGKPNNGTYTLNIAQGDGRLIGNPYSSAIDANEFIKDNLLPPGGNGTAGANVFNGTVYFYHHFGGESHYLRDYIAGYAAYNLIGGVQAISNNIMNNANNDLGGVVGQRFIPVAQGFFVNATQGATGGNITFKNSQRVFQRENVSSDQGSYFFKSNSKKHKENEVIEVDHRQKFILKFNSSLGYERPILVGVDENATNHFEFGYDALLADDIEEDMFWMIDNQKFVIQGVNNFDKTQELPIGIRVKESGLIKIKIEKLINLNESEIEIFVKDIVDGETYNIIDNDFEIYLETGEYFERFTIVFQPRLKTLNEVKLDDGIFVHMNKDFGELQFNRIVDTEILDISLFNYLGQQIRVWNKNTSERQFSLPVNEATGVYIVQIRTLNGVISKRVIIERDAN